MPGSVASFIAALFTHFASPQALPAQGWQLEGGATWTAAGTMHGHTCCKGWLAAERQVVLPAGGTVAVTVSAPCGQAVAVAVGDGPTAQWATGPRTDGAFTGVVTLSVSPDPVPRRLRIDVTGGLRCCGDVEVTAVAVSS